MKKYTVDFENRTRRQPRFIEAWEYTGPFFPREHFENIIRVLFYNAASGCDFDHLIARVKCEGSDVFSVKSDTTVDGSRIWATITMAKPHDHFRYLRTMVIAD